MVQPFMLTNWKLINRNNVQPFHSIMCVCVFFSLLLSVVLKWPHTLRRNSLINCANGNGRFRQTGEKPTSEKINLETIYNGKKWAIKMIS